MTKISKLFENTATYIDDIIAELSELEQKLNDAGDLADEWTKTQAEKLKADWKKAKDDIEDIAKRAKIEGEDAVFEAQQSTERHYEALRAAVKAYRDHLEQKTKI